MAGLIETFSSPATLIKSFITSLLLFYGFMISISVLFLIPLAYSKDISLQEDLVDEARITLQSFLSDEHMTWLRNHIKKARGIFVVPQIQKGAFYIRGSGGSGILIARSEATNQWSQPAFFTLVGVRSGLHFDSKASEILLLIMSQHVVDSLVTNTIQLGVDASIAAGPIGAGIEGSTAENLDADFISFLRAKGLVTEVSLEGAAVAARDAWNTAYYGKPTKTIDILVGRNVNNSHSTTLLQVVSEATQSE